MQWVSWLEWGLRAAVEPDSYAGTPLAALLLVSRVIVLKNVDWEFFTNRQASQGLFMTSAERPKSNAQARIDESPRPGFALRALPVLVLALVWVGCLDGSHRPAALRAFAPSAERGDRGGVS